MIGCIVQARLGSTRFPRKIMEKLNGESVLSFCINQIKFSKNIEKLIIATTTNTEDDAIKNYVEKLNLECFRGDPYDVLDRYYQCAKKFSLSVIVRITSDCPLIDPELIDKTISTFLKNTENLDYVSNVHPLRTFPHGTDVEVFSFASLKKTWENTKNPYDREHVTPYMYNDSSFNILNIKNKIDLSNYRWTLDYPQDLVLIKRIISQINKRPILTNHILKLFSNNPNLAKINKNFD